ncbi:MULTISPECIES: hypothetical protein [Streptomyces]|uniref:Lipoprotein n=2 Tax=Streptomyces TaxID=1883 RepID=A0A2U9PAY9_STRAS|nr:hypothetical protein [Streptomyces actuosus]AWT46747.1 hypothetical protein DMT42_33655 [Streptomyces actuosus]MBM4824120.1 hypothetical protein [Streptomyces actuosus]
MRAIRVASAALLGLGTLALTTPPAAAQGDGDITPFGFSVAPTTIAAGGQVSLRLERAQGGCKGAATITSGVFDTVTIRPGHSSATTAVDWDAKAGASYRVTFTCDGVSGWTDLAIAGGRTGPTPAPYPVPRGVHAGEGGSVAGFDLKEIGLGAALVASSVGVAYHLARRRSAEDGA